MGYFTGKTVIITGGGRAVLKDGRCGSIGYGIATAFAKEGAKWYLRIFIDKPEGISIEDCESIDGLINQVIDQQEFIDRIDYLEIGSAGLERPIRRIAQLEQSVGKKVKVTTGVSDDEYTEITKGLSKGDKVIVDGKDYLSETNNEINITGNY